MSNPFDFSNTPITGNTQLVARYRSTTESGGYAGNWFRLTDTSGVRYVPADEGQARSVAGTIVAGSSITLLDESTGAPATITTNVVRKIELGKWFEPYNSTSFFAATAYSGVVALSGYAEGLNFTASSAVPFKSVNFHLALNLNGLKFDSYLFGFFTKNMGLFCTYTESNDSGAGIFGIVEPLEAPSDPTTSSNYIFSAYGKYAHLSPTFLNGIGFVGDYAQEWLKAYPTLTSGAISQSSTVRRNTFLG